MTQTDDMPEPSQTQNMFHVGERVLLHIGRHDLLATITEDRGPLGPDGGHVFRVAVLYALSEDPSEFEVPASSLRAVA